MLVASVAVAGAIATAAAALLAWPALTRPEPPSEAAADVEGVRIKLVQPPKAAVSRTALLDVGLSDAALAMAKGRQALSDTFTPAPPPQPVPRRAPVETTPLLVEDDVAPPPEDLADTQDDRWERSRQEATARARWERERRIDEAREERAAWERAAWERERLEDQRWRDARVEDDRHDPAPPSDDRAPQPPELW
jgi:hypothetical protein